MLTVKQRILKHLSNEGPGSIVIPKDFLDFANRGMVDVTLKQLVDDGTLLRIGRGLYHYPKRSKLLNTSLAPDVDAIAKAFARRFRWHIVPSGAHAVNLLGLSTQVPAKAVYLSDGPSKTIKIGARELSFKHARPKDLAADADPISASFVQAMRFLGQDAVDAELLRALRARLSKPARRRLARDTRYVSDWIHEAAQTLAKDDK